MPFDKFPRAPDNAVSALKGNVWNRVAQKLESDLNIQVAPPLMLSQTPTGVLITTAKVAPSQNLFVVALTQTGGSNGTQFTSASWTYTAKSLDGVTTYGTVLTPQRPRPNGTATAATLGSGYYDNTNTFKLYEALEYFGTGHC